MTDTASYRLPRQALPRRYELELAPDLTQARFDGRARIDVEVTAPIEALVLNGADLEITDATVSGAAATATVDAELERVTVTTGEPLSPGAYTLELGFRGVLNDQLRGFYRSTFELPSGPQVIATTQFEAADARRAFPCWDEPDFKATFAVTLVVDEPLTALSNGRAVREEPAGGGRRRITFAETMPMSTYLVAFIVGPLELTEPVDVRGVPLRVAAVPGKSHLTGYATEIGAFCLAYLADYFGLPYPHDKIDHVAIPDFAFGAMENLGCVTYRETALLIDEATASQMELRRVAHVVSHETAHMWFGDLVTMKWWNGIWLNEAFATFMETTTADAFRPDWDVWTTFGVSKAAALGTDGLRATRPVEFEVGPPHEAEAMFDVLTYQKGGSVLKMLEQYLGPDVFRAGISTYLERHSHGNTETVDLWDAIEASSGEPVRAIMDTFILQGGYPLVTVIPSADGRGVTLRQHRFLYDGSGENDPQSWVIPINLRAGVGCRTVRQRVLLEGDEVEVRWDEPFEWVVVNDGSWGFYRVAYPPELIARLRAADPGATGLSALERMTLAGDLWARVVAGDAELADWLEVAEWVLGASVADEGATSASGDADPDVVSAILAPLDLLDMIAEGDDRDRVAALVRRLATPLFRAVGWDPAEGEPSRRGTLRSRLVAALGTLGADAEVQAEAARRLEGWWETATGLAPDLLAAVTAVVASVADEARYEQLRTRYREAATPQEQLRYLSALTQAPAEELLRRTLDLTLTDEVRSQDASMLIGAVLSRRAGRRPALEWMAARWDEAAERFPRNGMSRMLDGVPSLIEPDLTALAEQVLADHPLPQAQAQTRQLLERMHVNAGLALRLRPGLAAALG